jgi:hypothetical protein
MSDGAHFWRLRDSFMCRLSDFLHHSLLVIHHNQSFPLLDPHPLASSAATTTALWTHNSYGAVLCFFPLCRTLSSISHLSSAGCHLIRQLHHVVPSSFSCSGFHGRKDGGCRSTTAARVEVPLGSSTLTLEVPLGSSTLAADVCVPCVPWSTSVA